MVFPFLRYPDLGRLDMANRLVIAERLSEGQISEAEADQQFSQLHSQIVAEEQRRNLANRSVSAQETAAAAASRAASPTCVTSGYVVSCF